MSEMPLDPFNGNDDEALMDFLPLLKNARRIYEAAQLSGFSQPEAMHLMISIVTSMINNAVKKALRLHPCRIPD